ncbi:hypothetical protein C8034_v000308 [Colletotrichum sidae]|uniref:Uncharacterized protein n=1 Tax=Colletotrichum sidae TaxID=1347389 RepID=A0A4R8TGB6_9PEZI|nr:hypothetical protein C8034_v000308 [Colletotrichum sidae]
MENPDHRDAANGVPMAGTILLPTEIILQIMEELANQIKSQFRPILYRLVHKPAEPGGLRIDRIVGLGYSPRYRKIRSVWSINHYFKPRVRNSSDVLQFTNLLTPPLHEVFHFVENIRLESTAKYTDEREGFERDPTALLSLPNLRKISIEVGREEELYMWPAELLLRRPLYQHIQPINHYIYPGLAEWELD